MRRLKVVLALSGFRVEPDGRALDPDIDVLDIGGAEKGIDSGNVQGVVDAEILVASPGPKRFAEIVEHMPRLGGSTPEEWVSIGTSPCSLAGPACS